MRTVFAIAFATLTYPALLNLRRSRRFLPAPRATSQI